MRGRGEHHTPHSTVRVGRGKISDVMALRQMRHKAVLVGHYDPKIEVLDWAVCDTQEGLCHICLQVRSSLSWPLYPRAID